MPFPSPGGILPTQGSNLGLLHCRQTLYPLSHQGRPILSKVKSLGHVRLFATPWTVAYQAPLSMGFSRQEYWSGLPFPSPGDLPNPGIEPRSSTFQADTLTSEPPGKPSRHATRQIPLLSSPQASAIIWYWEEEHVQLQANGY